MLRRLVSGTLVAGVALLAGPVWAQGTETEEETHTTFQIQKNIGGIPHLLIGTGAREATALRINVYGGGFYVGMPHGSKVWGQYLTGRFAKGGLVSNGQPDLAKLKTHRLLRHFVVYGNFPKAIDMAFVRDVRDDQVRGAYEESWDRVGLDRAAAGDALNQFMAAVNHPMSKGQRMMIRTVGNNIVVQMPSGTAKIKGNRVFVRAIWQIWFGEPALQAPLRDGMLSNIDRLHKAYSGS